MTTLTMADSFPWKPRSWDSKDGAMTSPDLDPVSSLLNDTSAAPLAPSGRRRRPRPHVDRVPAPARHHPSHDPGSGTSASGSKPKAASTQAYSKGIQQIVILTEFMVPLVKTAGKNDSISIGVLSAANNYTMTKDLENGIQDISKSVWVCIKPGISDNFRKKVVTINNERKASLKGLLGSVLDLRLMLVEGMTRKDLHKDLKQIRSLDIKDSDQESLDNAVQLLLKNHRDSKGRVESVIRDKAHSEMFVEVELRLYGSKMKPSEDSSPLQTAVTRVQTLMTDTTTAIRQHFQKHFRCPHIKLSIRERSNTEVGCLFQMRLYESSAAQAFHAALKDGTIEHVFRQHISTDDSVYEGRMQVIVDSNKLESVIRVICGEETKAEGRKIQRMLEADGGGTVTMSEGLYRAEPTPLSGDDREAVKLAQKSALIIELAEQYIKDRKRTPYEFIQMVSRSCSKPEEWVMLRNSTDYNIMHIAIINSRHDFLELFLYKGVWGLFRQDVARPVGGSNTPTAHMGYTSRRVAESYAYKEQGQETLNLYDSLDQLWDGATPLMLACLQSELSVVKALVELDPETLGAKDEQGSTCLFYACGRGDRDIVKFLLSKNVDPDQKNGEDRTCIILAAMYGHVDVLEELSRYTFRLYGELTVPSFYSAIDYCALNGHIEGLQFFHKKKIIKTGDRILTLAAKNKQGRVLTYILEQFSPITLESKESCDEMQRTAICHTTLNADQVSFKLLVSKNADLKVRDLHRNNILHMAVESGSVDMVNLVVNHLSETGDLDKLLDEQNIYTGRDTLYMVRGKDQGRRAWHWVELNRFLLHKFKECLKSGQVDVVRFGILLRSGFAVIEDKETKTLMKNFTDGKVREAVADMTPLHLALSKNLTATAKLLLDRGANPNARDHFHATPLHYACMYGNIDVLQVLEVRQASLEARTVDNKTPTEVAELNNQQTTVNYIEAKVTVLKTKNFMDNLDKADLKLKEDNLDKRRMQGRNVRRFMIETLRDLSIDVNVMLQELDSGPVLESSN